MVAAVLGRPYHISFGGSTLYQHAADVARTFIAASRAGLAGAHTANLGGAAAHMSEVVALIEQQVPSAAGTITFEERPLPFPADIDSSGLAVLGEVPVTPFADGVADDHRPLPRACREGRLNAAEQGLDPPEAGPLRGCAAVRLPAGSDQGGGERAGCNGPADPRASTRLWHERPSPPRPPGS